MDGNEKNKHSCMRFIVKLSLCLGVGLILSAATALSLLDLQGYPLIGRFLLIVIPSGAFAFLLFQVFEGLVRQWMGVTPSMQLGLTVWAALISGTLTMLMQDSPLFLKIIVFVSGWIAGMLVLLPTLNAMDWLVANRQLPSLLLAGVATGSFDVFLLSFLSTILHDALGYIFVILAFNLGLGLFFFFVILRRKTAWEWLILGVIFLFALTCTWLYVSFLPATNPGLASSPVPNGLFSILLTLIITPWLAWTYLFLHGSSTWTAWRQSKAFSFFKTHHAIILLALLFFISYLALANIFNLERYGGDNMFFDSDADTWRIRLSTPNWVDPYWRTVHPNVLLILRPIVALAGVFLAGNWTLAALVVTAAAGAAGVFLIWQVTWNAMRDQAYALLIAAIFGISTSQIIFGALVETYIFSTLLLLLFLVALQNQKTPFFVLVSLGVMTMGITITNLIQNVLSLFAFKPDIKLTVRFGAMVVSSVIALSLVNNIVYPRSSPLFIIPATMGTERVNFHAVSNPRIQLAIRELLVYSEVAPHPVVLTDRTVYPRFWFYTEVLTPRKKIVEEIGQYEGLLGTGVAYFWVVLVGVSAIAFVYQLWKRIGQGRTPLALVLMLVFNFSLHVFYGNELFLYTPHLAYALVLFVFLSLSIFLKQRWYMPVLFVFLLLALVNNVFFLASMTDILRAAVIRAGS